MGYSPQGHKELDMTKQLTNLCKNVATKLSLFSLLSQSNF